jgi:hypothetical protein
MIDFHLQFLRTSHRKKIVVNTSYRDIGVHVLYIPLIFEVALRNTAIFSKLQGISPGAG